MKHSLFSLSVALLAPLCVSCSGDGGNPTSNSLAENGQVVINDDNEVGNPYAGSGKIYMAEERNSSGQLVLTEDAMLEVGTMSNGEIYLDLPANVDSRFLSKLESVPAGLDIEPLGAEVWFYTNPLRLLNNGQHIGNLDYTKIQNDGTYHVIRYWYFSKATRISGLEYKIEAKKGWNKIYTRGTNDESTHTTDLSKVPDGLNWLIREIK